MLLPAVSVGLERVELPVCRGEGGVVDGRHGKISSAAPTTAIWARVADGSKVRGTNVLNGMECCEGCAEGGRVGK